MGQPVHHRNGVGPVYGHGARAPKAVHAPDFTKRKREPDEDHVVDVGGCGQGPAEGQANGGYGFGASVDRMEIEEHEGEFEGCLPKRI